MKWLNRVDQGIEAGLQWATSTKEAFYALNILIIVAVIVHPPTTIQGWLLLVVSEYYQGVALPGLGSASRKEGNATRAVQQETHDTVMKEFAEIKQMHEEERQARLRLEVKLNVLLSRLQDVDTFQSRRGFDQALSGDPEFND